MVKYIDTRLLQGQEKLYAGENDPVYGIDENIINDLPAAKVIEIDFVRNYLLNLIEKCENADSAQIKAYLQKTLDDLEECSEKEFKQWRKN